MIKETVNAVRLAEMKAGRTVNEAEENAQEKKNQVKSQAEEYRENVLQEAREKADLEMKATIKKCKDYSEQMNKEIETKVSDLQTAASGKMEEAVNAVIRAFV